MAVPSMLWLAAPLIRKECIVYRLTSMPAARRWVGRLVVICAGVNARFPSPRLLQRPETETLTPRQVPIATRIL